MEVYMVSDIEKWIWFYYDNCNFSIIPIKERDKRPNITSWELYKTQRPTKEEIKQWLNKDLFKNIAVIGGKVSGNLVCFDLDDPEAFKDLNLDINILIKQGVWVVETPKQKGRYHIIVRDKKDIEITRNVKQDIDMRANGHYWVVYPSIHPNGNQYNLLNTHDLNELKLPVKVHTKKMFDDWIKILYKQRGVKETLQDIIKAKDEYDKSPNCIRNAWELGAKPGGRYYTAVALGSWMQQQRFPLEMTRAVIIEWFKNKCINDGRPITDIEKAIAVGYDKEYQTGCSWWRENTDFCPYANRKDCSFLHSKTFEKFNIEKKLEVFKNNQKLIYEPIINSGEIKYLIFSPENSFKFQDSDLWACTRCGKTIKSEKKPYYCDLCEKEINFKRTTEHINPDLWKLPNWEDIPVDNLDMQNTFLDIIQLIKQCLIFPDEIQYKLLTLWIIASWKQENWNTIPFLIFRGLIETGKTRALEIIRELGYRMIHCSGVTFPAMIRATNNWNAGILLDEIDNKVDKRTETGRLYIDFLKPSYRQGSRYTVANLDNQDEIKSYKNFGFKAFAGEKGGYDQAIFDRSLDFRMEQDYPEITELKTIQDDFNQLQTILLNYRYKTNNPPNLPENIKLKGRTREIYSCLIRTAIHIGIEYDDIIKYIEETQQEKQEEIENTDEYQVLKIIKNFECQPTLDDSPETISYSDIAEELGWEPEKRQKLGYIFKKKLILKTKRRNKGSVVLLTDSKNVRRLKHLYRRFKLEK